MTEGFKVRSDASDAGTQAGRAAEQPTPGEASLKKMHDQNRQQSSGRRLLSVLSPRRLSAVYLAVFFIVLFTVLKPETYPTSTTLTVVLGGGAITCLLALAFLVPLTTESFDLSIGTMMTFSLTITTKLFIETDLPLPLIAVIALACCALIGALSGFIIVRLHVNSFIATLGVSQLLLALILLISNNKQLVGSFPRWWSDAGNNTLFSIPYPFLMLIVVALILWYILEKTAVGRFMFATGGNPEAARLSGVRTGKVIWGSMIGSAVIAGFAGLIYSMKVGTATPTVGDGLLFPAVAAVFLGASQLSMRPNVWGAIIAYFALEAGVQGLRLSFGAAASWIGPAFQGVALIIAVAIASRPIIKKIRARSAEKKAIAADQGAGASNG